MIRVQVGAARPRNALDRSDARVNALRLLPLDDPEHCTGKGKKERRKEKERMTEGLLLVPRNLQLLK